MITSALLPLLAGVGGLPPLSPADFIELDYGYQSRSWELTCLDYTNEEAGRRFEREFGSRMKRVRLWAQKKFGEAALAAALEREWPGGMIFVGGCRNGMDESGRSSASFQFGRELRVVEQRIASEEH